MDMARVKLANIKYLFNFSISCDIFKFAANLKQRILAISRDDYRTFSNREYVEIIMK